MNFGENLNFFARIFTTRKSLPPTGLQDMYGSLPMNDIFSSFPWVLCKCFGHCSLYSSAFVFPNVGHRDVLTTFLSVKNNYSHIFYAVLAKKLSSLIISTGSEVIQHHIEVYCLILEIIHVKFVGYNCQILLSNPEISHNVNQL